VAKVTSTLQCSLIDILIDTGDNVSVVLLLYVVDDLTGVTQLHDVLHVLSLTVQHNNLCTTDRHLFQGLEQTHMTSLAVNKHLVCM